LVSRLTGRYQKTGLVSPSLAQRTGRGMLRELMNTQNDHALALARMASGVVFYAHGAQKILGWFGRSGFSETIGEFAKFRMSTAVALFAIFVEFFGSLSLMFGLLSRMATLAIILEMIGAVLTVHIRNGFVMNWTGHQKGEGFEYRGHSGVPDLGPGCMGSVYRPPYVFARYQSGA
jgi:putative oxidoreductase